MNNSIDEKYKNIWTEKYRPSTIDDLVIPKETRKKLESYRQAQEIPNLCFIHSPGTGKTSTAKVIVKDILKCDYLYINASDETGIDTIRTKVIGFAQTKAIDSKIKTIILDECLDENTLVTILTNGKEEKRKIKNLNDKFDLVKTYNIETNSIEWKPFILFTKGEQEVFEMKLANGETVICTADHKWYVNINGVTSKKKLSYIIEHNITEILTPI